MDNNVKTNYLEDRLHGLNRNEIIGAEFYLKDLERLADNATSLKDCFDIHKAAVELGIINKNLDADPSGVFRCDDIHRLTKDEVFLGGQYGIYTKDLNLFESNRYQRPDAYMLALSQYKKLLSSNFREIRDKVFQAEIEEEKESRRNVIARIVSPGKYASRKGTEYMPVIHQNKERFQKAYASAEGAETASDKISTILTNEEAKHKAVNKLLAKMNAEGRTSFQIEKEAFDDWVPAITVGSTKYIVDIVSAENSMLTFIARAYDGKALSVSVGGDNFSYVTGMLKDKDGHNTNLDRTDAESIQNRLPAIASMAYVNLDWQARMVEDFRQSLPGPQQNAVRGLPGGEEEKELQALDKLCDYYTIEQFKLLFPNVRLSDCNAVERKDGMDVHTYGVADDGGQRFVKICPQGTTNDGCWRFETTTNYGTHPNGNELKFDRSGMATEFKINLTPRYSQKCFSSDSVFFRPDGGIDKAKTMEAIGKSDFPVSFTEILENIEFKLQERQNNQMTVVMKAGKGFIGKDQDGFTLLDRKKNDLLNGLRFDVLTRPVNGICVGKVDGQYTLVNVNKGEMVDKVMRPYIGEMTPDGWALIREKQNGMDRYNYINASGEKMSPRGFDYATEFREGKATVMVGKQSCELNRGGVVTNVEITDTTSVKENKTVHMKM